MKGIVLAVTSLITMVILITLVQEQQHYPNLVKSDYIAKIDSLSFTYGGKAIFEHNGKTSAYSLYPSYYADRDYESEMIPGSLVIIQSLQDNKMTDISMIDSDGTLIAGIKPLS